MSGSVLSLIGDFFGCAIGGCCDSASAGIEAECLGPMSISSDLATTASFSSFIFCSFWNISNMLPSCASSERFAGRGPSGTTCGRTSNGMAGSSVCSDIISLSVSIGSMESPGAIVISDAIFTVLSDATPGRLVARRVVGMSSALLPASVGALNSSMEKSSEATVSFPLGIRFDLLSARVAPIVAAKLWLFIVFIVALFLLGLCGRAFSDFSVLLVCISMSSSSLQPFFTF
jgi:hypothetical protein